jgi:hypothetical protein
MNKWKISQSGNYDIEKVIVKKYLRTRFTGTSKARQLMHIDIRDYSVSQ